MCVYTYSSVLIYIPKEKDVENQICRKQNWKKKKAKNHCFDISQLKQ